jgi:hypothetical protein
MGIFSHLSPLGASLIGVMDGLGVIVLLGAFVGLTGALWGISELAFGSLAFTNVAVIRNKQTNNII